MPNIAAFIFTKICLALDSRHRTLDSINSIVDFTSITSLHDMPFMIAVESLPLRLDFPAWFALPYLFIIGAMIGSFLNVCIYRIPTQDRFLDQLKSLSNRPSHCPRCGTNIRWFDNVPIFGWLKLRGRCRQCRMRISPRYPLIEFFNGCLWVLVFCMEVPLGMYTHLSDSCVYSDIGPQAFPGLGPLSPEWFVIIRFAFHLVLIEALLVASFIDFDLRIIPDGSTLPAMLFAIVCGLVIARVHLVPVWFQSPNMEQSFAIVTPDWVHPLLRGGAVPGWINLHPHLHGLAVSLAGLVVGGGLVWAVRLLGHFVLRREAMGFGDVILMGMIGAFLGWQATVIAFFIAAMCAILVVAVGFAWHGVQWLRGRPRTIDWMIPYGPYLSLGAVITILFWQPLFARTRHVFEMGVLLLPITLVMGIVFVVSLVLVQLAKRLLGISTDPPSPILWRPADQTWFFKGEHVDRHTCQWKTRDWDGCASGQGTIHAERWKQGNGGTQNWGGKRGL
ncbi:prepilin peptidase [Planctomicrobium piriforme]|uniref:Leader peptidase (Prepilin peptidase) / N-methyltransferase n=1 Tax=Planctomicrobium piriforme TaxID=1576369 RepID=A0A1I3NEL2_9PLAN|nr:A24 family peptidase [Planctomicrobium piriforme]SFJ07635.1 leader peptidase (prepilin peptidase) / N-methyltransferase [Planctomicrobium piriforme]